MPAIPISLPLSSVLHSCSHILHCTPLQLVKLMLPFARIKKEGRDRKTDRGKGQYLEVCSLRHFLWPKSPENSALGFQAKALLNIKCNLLLFSSSPFVDVVKLNQSWMEVKVVKANFIQDYCNRKKKRIHYRTGLRSGQNKDNKDLQPKAGRGSGWKITKRKQGGKGDSG